MAQQAPAALSEERVVAQFGYKPELRRTLKFFSVFAVAFSIISITTGIFLNYQTSFGTVGPVMIWTWPVAGVGQILVALILAELATRIPLAGANYQWGARLVNPTYGWFVGALGVMYGAVGIPGILYLAAAPFTAYVLNLSSAGPHTILFIALLLMTVAYLANVVSIQLAARVNNVAVFAEILGTVVGALVLFFLWVANYKPTTHHGFAYLGHHFHMPGQPYWYALLLASLIGVYTIVGFEAAADMSEEAVDARRSVPRAMIGSVVVSVVLGMVALIGFTVAVPSDKVMETFGLPGEFQYWLGSDLARAFVGVVVFAMFALTVVGAAANARLLFAMGRDNIAPGSSVLRRVQSRTQTPIPALIVSYLICVGVMLYGYNAGGSAFPTLVGATALVPFIIYLLTVVAYGIQRRNIEHMPGAFHLRRWAVPVFAASLVSLVLVVLALSLPQEFHKADYYVLGGLALAAIWWVVGLRLRLRRGTARIGHIPEEPEEEPPVATVSGPVG
jgi:amino acid transporter